uniref:Uncharacterized protein n=1 Tax=Meloidogyne enterolobii TaxID=390850 RepID=A0A6V7VQR1_MELEN|nr:unnamed protein product [Meloidogyne enterolobii]
MADRSKINRTTASDFGNIRDAEDDDDNEFFANDDNFDDEECEVNDAPEDHAGLQQPIDHTSGSSQATSTVGRTCSNSSFRRVPMSNLSKITEAPDELSYSFKHGENALQVINEDHERLGHENYLRLPSGSFHTSQYSIKNSWEESALRCQNAIIRSELDLSSIQIPTKANNSINLDNLKNSPKQTSIHQIPKDSTKNSTTFNSIPQQQQRPLLSPSRFLNKSINNAKPFISGTRYTVYFGFKRLDGLDSEEFLRIHNIHYGRERLIISCWIKNSSKSDNCFKLVSPAEKVSSILEWDAYQKIIISFTPTSAEHYANYLFIHCQSRHESRKYKFCVHGYGGRSIITPCIEDRINNLLLSANGRYQLLVNSTNSFNFILQNQGNRAAFASIFIYGRGGELIPNHEAMVSTRNVIINKKGQDDSRRSISVRCLTDRRSFQSQNKSAHRPSTLSLVISALGMSTSRDESALQIVIFWGEERQRQRLKHFEKKLGGQLLTFGQNFTKFMNFTGESEDWAKENLEHYVSEEEFYYFDANVKLIFIDVHEKRSFDRASSVNISGGVIQPLQRQQLRAGSSLSVASSGESTGRSRQQQLCTIVERDPDNTLVGVGSVHDSTDDTLTLI